MGYRQGDPTSTRIDISARLKALACAAPEPLPIMFSLISEFMSKTNVLVARILKSHMTAPCNESVGVQCEPKQRFKALQCGSRTNCHKWAPFWAPKRASESLPLKGSVARHTGPSEMGARQQ